MRINCRRYSDRNKTLLITQTIQRTELIRLTYTECSHDCSFAAVMCDVTEHVPFWSVPFRYVPLRFFGGFDKLLECFLSALLSGCVGVE